MGRNWFPPTLGSTWVFACKFYNRLIIDEKKRDFSPKSGQSI
jgi:hypothetical protein